MIRRLVRLLVAVLGELLLIGVALLAVSFLLCLPRNLTWTYPWGIPIPHSPPGVSLWTAVYKLWQPLLHGSLGAANGYAVSKALPSPAWHSLVLLLAGFVLAAGLGILKGVWDFRALSRRRFSLLPATTALMQGLPDYWVILLFQWAVGWLVSHQVHIGLLVGYEPRHPVKSLLFPLLIIALIPAGAIAHITGEALLDVVGSDAVRTARAKGLHSVLVIWKHALRLALVEVLDALPAVLSMMLTNLVIVETLTVYPGLGRLLVIGLRLLKAPAARVDAQTAFAAALVLLGTFFLALEGLRVLRRLADPRLRAEVRR